MENPFKNTIYEDACLSKIDFELEDSKKVSAWLEKPQGIMFVHSEPGYGKSYMCAAITNMRLSNKEYCWAMSEQDLFQKLRVCIQNDGDYSYILNMICDNYFLILDDLGSTRNQSSEKAGMTDWQKEVLFTFLDKRVTSNLPTIITSNYTIQELGNIFHERFTSRLGASKNTIIKLKGSDKRQLGL